MPIRTIIAAGTLLVGFVAAAAAEPLILNVTYSSGAYTDVMNESARAFEAAHPDVKIQYRAPVLNSYDELMQSTFRAATIGDLPDVSLEGNQNVSILAARGIPVALDGLIAGEVDWLQQGYLPAVADVGRFGDSTYAFAYATSVPIVFVNVDLLHRAGIADVGTLGTWDDLTAAAAKIQALGGGVVGGLFDYNSTGNWTFQALVTSQGASFLTSDGSDIAFDTAVGLRALRILKAFGDAGTVDMSQAQMIQAFGAGTVGVFASYSAATGQLEKQAVGKFAMRAIPWPIPAADGRIPAGGRTVMVYARDPLRQRAAWDFAKFLAGPVGQTIMVKGVGAVSVNTVANADPALLGTFYAEKPNHRAATEAVPRLTKWLAYPGENSIKTSEFVRDQLRRVYVEHQDPEVVMRDLVAGVRRLIGRR